MIVVADASPINYLLLIDRIGLLPALYGAIVIPSQVLEELQQTALIRASRLGLDDLDKSIARLKQTNFRIGPGLSAVLAPYLSKKDQD